MLNKTYTESTRWGLTINICKIKIIVLNKIDVGAVQLTPERTPFESVERFKYLESWLNSLVDIEIKSKIEQNRAAFLKLKSLRSNPHLNL